ncbi:MAG: HD domain-containing protein [Elusimicrobiales bacterium]|nr:HD domain-containing protein [Elusimicrobiales bacterium]
MTTLDADKQLQLLIKFGGLVSREPRLDPLLELIADQVRAILNADRCTVFLIDLQTNELWSKIAQGLEHQEIRIPMGKGLAGITAVTGETINSVLAYGDPRFSADIDRVTGYSTRNALTVPLKNNKGEMLGVFQVLNKLDGGDFTGDDIGLLTLLGTVAANSLENARLYEDIRRTQLETIYRLAITAEYRDQQDTALHLKNISAVSCLIAMSMGLSADDCEDIRQASTLHDIGKVGLCDAILHKPGKLTPGEYEEMKKHTIYGAKILANTESRLLRVAYRLACAHHEKFDGSGYPNKLKGGEIPLEARIVAVADVFDALCMPRVYKPAWGPQRAYDYVMAESGKSFDPEVLAAFKAAFPGILKIYENLPVGG